MINTCVPKKYDTNDDKSKDYNKKDDTLDDDDSYGEYDKNKATQGEEHEVKWTQEKLRDYYIDHNLDFDVLFDQICDIVAKTFIGVDGNFCDPINRQTNHRNNCFELYGFDILVDKNIRPWLLEVSYYISNKIR